MSEDSVSIKRIIDSWRKGECDYSSIDAKILAELLASIRSEMQLVDKTSKKREILQWYLNAVKSILEDYVTMKLLKSMSVSIKRIEKISQDANSLSWFSAAISEEVDLTPMVSHPAGGLKNRKVMAIV
ncbi:MAG: hypothetical protein QXR97_02120, partial [Thermoproteota archaeon]